MDRYDRNKIIASLTMHFFVALCFIFIFPGQVYAQYKTGTGCPINSGNVWTYQDDWFRLTDRYEVVDSQILLSGIYYSLVKIKHFRGGEVSIYNRLREDGYYVRYSPVDTITEIKYFKKKANLGDYWTDINFTGGPVYRIVTDTGSYNFYGKIVSFRQLFVTDSVFFFLFERWSDEIGLLYRQFWDPTPGAGEYEQLRGCVIDGIVYGDTLFPTSVREDNIKQDFTLFNNYPNPFNSATIISYNLNSESHVELTIYNLLGQKIKTLIDEYQSAGIYKVTFEAEGLPAGTYIYQLRTEYSIARNKMVYLK